MMSFTLYLLMMMMMTMSYPISSFCSPHNPDSPFRNPVTALLYAFSAGDVVDIYQREFLALRERLHSAEQENLRRSKELNLVLEEIKRAIAEKQALRDINRTWSSLSEETRLKLWNVSSSKNVLQLPSIFHHLPHLLNREDSLQPAIHLGQGRTG
ncbi:Alpha-1,3-mannosyl-glycoprotein 4-beta-N-acetylglucosaminyltransferase B, partial [Characodon lateralis]|nr:Alpha-1,3-mannosyl-glycoprotein 4-beta-N-acetylglucosaminyltransferase B [Characodon lateralis]